jgi:hypothetical protein
MKILVAAVFFSLLAGCSALSIKDSKNAPPGYSSTSQPDDIYKPN